MISWQKTDAFSDCFSGYGPRTSIQKRKAPAMWKICFTNPFIYASSRYTVPGNNLIYRDTIAVHFQYLWNADGQSDRKAGYQNEYDDGSGSLLGSSFSLFP